LSLSSIVSVFGDDAFFGSELAGSRTYSLFSHPVQVFPLSTMENQIIFDTRYATVTYYPDKFTLILIWNGNPLKEEYKLPFEKMLEFGRKHRVDGMLSDISDQGVVSPENRKWFEKELMPQASAAGLKRGAIVTNGNAFKLYYINLILSAVNKFPITTKLFNKRDEALTWLHGFPLS
jgi:hypothetical protein